MSEKQTTDPVAAALAVMRAHGLLVDIPDNVASLAIVDALDAAEDAQAHANQCDEPRCDKPASWGFPLPDGGYRRTCHEHGERAHGR